MKTIIKFAMIMMICGLNLGCSQSSAAADYTTVGPAQFVQDLAQDKEAYVLDVRTPQEFAEGHLPSAHNLDWLNQEAFRAGVASLPKDSTIYVYCRSGGRSAKASQYLSQRGFRVVNLAGGFADLSEAIR